jgi:hypothetical protein
MSGFYVNPQRGTFLFGARARAEVMEWNKVAEFKMPPYFLLFTPSLCHFARARARAPLVDL